MMRVEIRRPDRKFGWEIFVLDQTFDGKLVILRGEEWEEVQQNVETEPTLFLQDEAIDLLVEAWLNRSGKEYKPKEMVDTLLAVLQDELDDVKEVRDKSFSLLEKVVVSGIST